MKEIIIKFESEKDYEEFIKEIVEPSVEEGSIEYDAQNNIIIHKEIKNESN